jgi:transcriptional regulator with XRE-family HTH domain
MLRKAAGLTQTQVAAHLGISYQQVGKYERGESSMTIGCYETIRAFVANILRPGLAEDHVGYRSPAVSSVLVHDLKRIRTDIYAIGAKIDKLIRDTSLI